MCGRFTLIHPEEIKDRFDTVNDLEDKHPSFNVAPSFRIPVVSKNSPNKVELMKWGFIPYWAKDEKFKPINARDDTVATSPIFRDAFVHTRCIIPVSGFYEWKRISLEGKEEKIPYFIFLKSKEMFGFAGIYSVRKDAEGIEHKTVAIITTTPNALMKTIHNRMPVIIEKKNEEEWLTTESKDKAKLLLKPYSAADMDAYRVSSDVNSPVNNNPELLKQIKE